jgi:hypothetical protein
MGLTIKYPTICFYCKKLCEKGKGFLHRSNGKWFAHCFECNNKKLKERIKNEK